MRFTEINLFGVYVAPMSVMMVAAWFVTYLVALGRHPLRSVALSWHPSLLAFAVIVLSSMVLVAAR